MSQSRDEIAEQVVALAGSIGNEKAERMRELVAEARRKGAQASGSERPVIEECRLKKGERPAWFPNELLLDHVAAKAMQSTETPPNRACVDALTWHFAQAWKKAQPSGAPAPSVEEITRIVRDADQDFEGSGGSTRHWVRDCFLPALEKSGLRIVGAPAPASAQGEVCVEQARRDLLRSAAEAPIRIERAERYARGEDTPPSIEKTGGGASTRDGDAAAIPAVSTPPPASPASEVKACPSCGCAVVKVSKYGEVVCMGIDCTLRADSVHEWNRRAPAPPPASEVKALERVETGVVQFDDDWPGIFIRGDYALPLGMQLGLFLKSLSLEKSIIETAPLHALAGLLSSCNVRGSLGTIQVIERRAPAPSHIEPAIVRPVPAVEEEAPAPSPASGESARTASKDASKELDELLAVFAKGDDDDEDCWTQPARRAQLYVASLRADLNDAQVQEFMHRSRGDVLAEINDGLRAEVDRLRAALAEKEKAGVDVALVEGLVASCGRWARSAFNDLISMHESGTLQASTFSPEVKDLVPRIVALRTALGAKEAK